MIKTERAVEALMVGLLVVAGLKAALRQVASAEGAPQFHDARQAPGLDDKAREEAAKRAADEERKRLAEEAETLRRQVEATQAKAEAERQRLAEEAEALRKSAEAARRNAEAERLEHEKVLAAEKARREQEEQERMAAEARRTAEAEAKRKAEEEAERARQAAAAENARQRAEANAEAEAKRKVEEEAEAQRQAREAVAQARRIAEENAARERAEAQRRAVVQTENAASASEQNAVQGQQNAMSCDEGQPPRITTNGKPGGIVDLDIEAPCAKTKGLKITYGPYAFNRRLSESGTVSFTLDLFLGRNEAVAVTLDDGKRIPVSLPEIDLSGLSKVAIIWQAPVNLDLHALEYLARFSGEGHVWAGARSSFQDASTAAGASKGRGFMSSIAGDEQTGDKVEVYTFVRAPQQLSGVITTFVDYETRGDSPDGKMCGKEELAAVAFDVIELPPQGKPRRDKRELRSVPCGQALAQSDRYNPDTINDLQIRR